jgi:deoxyribonuclease IV
MDLLRAYGIGGHIKKQRTLTATANTIVASGIDRVPLQIFLGGTLSLAPKNVPGNELQETRDLIDRHGIRLFIHAPYTINLADNVETNVQCLRSHLAIATAIGAKGVVVHVGKHCERWTIEQARENMKRTIRAVIDPGYAGCPLLLETPTGQGTELLTDPEDFIGFCRDLSIGICIDTCHVFACGTCPMKYLDAVLASDATKDLLKLIHFNDSQGRLGCRKDRHAFPGTGQIDRAVLAAVAEKAHAHGIPMLTE